jgi:hypothetical protein
LLKLIINNLINWVLSAPLKLINFKSIYNFFIIFLAFFGLFFSIYVSIKHLVSYTDFLNVQNEKMRQFKIKLDNYQHEINHSFSYGSVDINPNFIGDVVRDLEQQEQKNIEKLNQFIKKSVCEHDDLILEEASFFKVFYLKTFGLGLILAVMTLNLSKIVEYTN